ncbi:hypothetical protein [Microvirga splendida]|uniref:Uncharacterized protein n=1 Tax=Microvirga splendida TaxID=2795727 RepID=A0ABS0XVT0_9HYPH|nr:hypothetical protein [Microvirga splendida]MBJ6124154.1 hypothetical protein [Microvirga splendida]
MARLIPDDRTRQGGSGRPVLGVLLGSLMLLVVAVAGYMIWATTSSPDDPGTDAARANVTGSTSGASDANPTNRIPPENPAYPAPNAQPSANPTPQQ